MGSLSEKLALLFGVIAIVLGGSVKIQKDVLEERKHEHDVLVEVALARAQGQEPVAAFMNMKTTDSVEERNAAINLVYYGITTGEKK